MTLMTFAQIIASGFILILMAKAFLTDPIVDALNVQTDETCALIDQNQKETMEFLWADAWTRRTAHTMELMQRQKDPEAMGLGHEAEAK